MENELDRTFFTYMTRQATLPTIHRLLQIAWCRETSGPGYRDKWTPLQPSIGQCAVTALLVQDLFGGEIIRCEVKGFGSHYYNRIEVPPDDRMEDLDLTKDQFPGDAVFSRGKIASRHAMLSSPRAIAAQTGNRYQLLKRRLIDIMQAGISHPPRVG